MFDFLRRLFKGKPDPLETALRTAAIDPLVYSAAIAARVTDDLLAERRGTRRWLWIRRSFYAAITVLGLVVYLAGASQKLGWQFLPKEDLIATVRISGGISAGELASSDQIIPALRRAYEAPQVKGILLVIDSGGGAPVEAERINTFIAQQRKLHPKPIVAVIQNIGASAAYMIGMHADKIVCANYSAVGSIGAVMSAWDVSSLMGRFDVRQHVYASGPLKTMLSPFAAPSSAANTKAQELVNEMGADFLADMKSKRGHKLNPNVEYGTGEVWIGTTALKLGLVDEIGTTETAAAAMNPNAKIHDFGPAASAGGFMGMSVERLFAGVADAIADRALATTSGPR